MKTTHITLTSALITVEDLVAQGHTSFKVWRQESVWHVSLSNVEVMFIEIDIDTIYNYANMRGILVKNSAVREMIVNQYNWVDRNDISVIFVAAIGNQSEFDVSLVDDDVYKEFSVKVEMEEKK